MIIFFVVKDTERKNERERWGGREKDRKREGER